jgi:hypothetical protein
MTRLLTRLLFVTLFAASFNSYADRPAASDEQTNDETASAERMTEAAPPVTVTNTTMQPAAQSPHVITMDDNTQIPVMVLDFPLRGMTMDKVINEMGQPLNKFPAIGKPPITRWDYPDRTVFFEYTSVIHVVAR